jgi:hypothetical protein
MGKNFDKLHALWNNNPGEFREALASADRTRYFVRQHLEIGLDFLGTDFPEKIADFSERVSVGENIRKDPTASVENVCGWLHEGIVEEIKRKKDYREDPLEWEDNLKEYGLEKQLAIKNLQRSGKIDLLERGEIDKFTLIDFVRNFEPFPESKEWTTNIFVRKKDGLSEWYKIFVDKGKIVAEGHLRNVGVRPKQRKGIIESFGRHYDDYLGKTVLLGTSKAQDDLEKSFEDAGIFYLREVRYPNTRKRADFVVGDTWIEVVGEEDDFIHTEKYWKGIKEKQEIVGRLGDKFRIYCPPFDSKEELVNSVSHFTTKPEEAYGYPRKEWIEKGGLHSGSPGIRGDVASSVERKKLYFVKNPYIGAQIRKNLAS